MEEEENITGPAGSLLKLVWHGFLVILILLVIIGIWVTAHYLREEVSGADACKEIGICREGRRIDDCPEVGKVCIIGKETCRKIGGKWYADLRACDTSVMESKRAKSAETPRLF